MTEPKKKNNVIKLKHYKTFYSVFIKDAVVAQWCKQQHDVWSNRAIPLSISNTHIKKI